MFGEEGRCMRKIKLTLFNKNQIKFNWSTLLVGLELKCLQLQEITDFARDYLASSEDVFHESIIELAWGNLREFEVEKLLREISVQDSDIDYEREKRKLRYCTLVNLNDTIKDKRLLLDEIALVYSDFDYPEDMDDFIYYLPQEKKEQHELGVSMLVDNFRLFLQREYHNVRE
jgi:hypothetical protein